MSATGVGVGVSTRPSPGVTAARTDEPVGASATGWVRRAAARLSVGVRAVATSVRWYVRESTGEAAYDRYVAAHAAEHPDHPPLTRAQWWRARDAAREHTVTTGCC